jgi:hypothetical protein
MRVAVALLPLPPESLRHVHGAFWSSEARERPPLVLSGHFSGDPPEGHVVTTLAPQNMWTSIK